MLSSECMDIPNISRGFGFGFMAFLARFMICRCGGGCVGGFPRNSPTECPLKRDHLNDKHVGCAKAFKDETTVMRRRLSER